MMQVFHSDNVYFVGVRQLLCVFKEVIYVYYMFVLRQESYQQDSILFYVINTKDVGDTLELF
jgi:hypothetical protein